MHQTNYGGGILAYVTTWSATYRRECMSFIWRLRFLITIGSLLVSDTISKQPSTHK